MYASDSFSIISLNRYYIDVCNLTWSVVVTKKLMSRYLWTVIRECRSTRVSGYDGIMTYFTSIYVLRFHNAFLKRKRRLHFLFVRKALPIAKQVFKFAELIERTTILVSGTRNDILTSHPIDQHYRSPFPFDFLHAEKEFNPV